MELSTIWRFREGVGAGVNFLDSLNNLRTDFPKNFAYHKVSFMSYSVACSR